MSLLDGGDIDPSMLSLLGAASGFSSGMAPYLGYSRLPQSTAQALAGGVGGMTSGFVGGMQAGQQSKLQGQAIQRGALGNAMTMAQLRLMHQQLPGIYPDPDTLLGGPKAGGFGSSSSGSPGTMLAGNLGPQGTATDAGQGTGGMDAPGMQGSLLGGPNASPGAFPQSELQQILTAKFMGVPDALVASHFPGPQNMRQGSTMFDPATGRVIFRNPNLSPDLDFDPVTGKAFPVPGAAAGAATITRANEQAKAGFEPMTVIGPDGTQYTVPRSALGNGQPLPSGLSPGAAATQEQQAQLQREKAMGSFNYGLEYGAPPGGQQSAASSFTIPQVGAAFGAPGPRANVAAPQGSSPQPGAIPPIVQIPSAATGSQANGMPTPQSTIIPPLSAAAPIPTASKELDTRIPEWNKTQTDWAKALPSTIVAEQRALAIASALKLTESGQFATEKANIKSTLHAVGIDLPDDTFGNPAQVETALKDNFSSVLEQIKAFSSRPAAAEVTLGQKNFSNPNLQPEANLNIISQTVGQMRWERALMNDFKTAKSMGWRDPQDFQQAWMQIPQNSLQGFMDRAKQEIGPLKGMPGAPGSPAKPFDVTTLPPAAQQQANTVKQNYGQGMFGKPGSPEAQAAAQAKLKALGFPD